MYDFKPPYYGAAYYPESWPREEVDADLDRLVSHGLNTVRVGEFAWSTMEPEEGKYDFSLFREVVDKCKARGISVVMCTPSATPPSWMAHKYPEIFASDGVKQAKHGHRRTTCPTNKLYRRFCAEIVEAMAKEFALDENIIGWQIDNEFHAMIFGTGCDCPACTDGFRDFLRERYHNDINELNDAWGHYTWSLNFSTFNEIDPFYTYTALPAVHKYMWDQYKSLSISDFCRVQHDIIRKYTDKPVGTDMMPMLQVDPAETNSHLDIVQFNYYGTPSNMKFWLDTYRANMDRPIWLTETSSCWNGGNQPNGSRRKGFCKANTLMSFASGGEMALYWLFRSHRGGYEMAHGSVVDAWGRDMQCSPEIREISALLDKLRPALEGTRHTSDGIAIQFSHLPYVIDKYCTFETVGQRYSYENDIQSRIYPAFSRQHFRPDVISSYKDLTPYKLLISHRQMTLEEGDFLDRILPWVEAGGTWVAGPYTDIFTKDLAKYRSGPFGHLEDWAKVTRAYYIPAPNGNLPGANEGKLPTVCFADGSTGTTVENLSFDALVPGEDVKVLASYAEGTEYLEGYAAITETKVGKGRIILMGVQLDTASYRAFIKKVAAECGITPTSEGSDEVMISILEGEGSTVFTAIECFARQSKITIPFDSVDLETGTRYTAGQVVDMPPYHCIFAKKA